jgi:hypothetical protein
MPATNCLRHVAQWQNCPVKPLDIVAAQESAFGTKRTFAAPQKLVAIGVTADIGEPSKIISRHTRAADVTSEVTMRGLDGFVAGWL